MNPTNNPHEHWIRRTLKLAMKAKGYTSPNPMVGAVIVDNEGNLLSEGFHQKYGLEHAEVNALKLASKEGLKKRLQDATIYVNLEPCCHYGKTPPCTKAIIESGIKRVVIGSTDPNPKVSGQGIKELKENGIEVISGVLEKECDELNRFFFHWIKTKKPWVTLKIAATLDGKIHLGAKGKRITGPEVQKMVHELRAEHDAILTGSGTVLADDPQLNVRLVEGKNPIKVVLDRRLHTTPKHKISEGETQTLIFTNSENLQKHSFGDNVQLLVYPQGRNTKEALAEILLTLGERGILSVLVEAGQQINSIFIQEKAFNEIMYFINPSINSMEDSISVTCNSYLKLRIQDIKMIGNDLLIRFLP
ncbi:MAG: bifunctional diaminohydroxyphosphoribosylaminopyrimidine deaminase/5-amino-6-(5-phosphoribosylamino)uracil reductase RibD [Candidatus Caenarcaniphilales bacterium]|nr:bifunctional diaminohydroxyphosphoribosylaminopyrimidine deaminase/5-amino-6-(5-phosphoribosylamino)uracil reductase RibD [Candidatus Caenarcaniphilales bacterium]